MPCFIIFKKEWNDQYLVKYYYFFLDFNEFSFDFQMQYTKKCPIKVDFFTILGRVKRKSSKPPGFLPPHLHQGSVLD